MDPAGVFKHQQGEPAPGQLDSKGAPPFRNLALESACLVKVSCVDGDINNSTGSHNKNAY